jgi:hypothetical protein
MIQTLINMKKLFLTMLLIFSIQITQAQSHISTGKWQCQLVPSSLGYEKYTCPACDAQNKKEQAAKIAEEKRRFADAQAAATAKKEAREKERLEKIEEDKKNAESGKVYINSSNSAANTNSSNQQIPDSYTGNPLHYNNPNVSSGSSTVDNMAKSYAQGQQIAEIATGLISLFSKSPEQIQREEEQRQREEERIQKEADLKANKLRLINSRKKLIAQYPDGKTPLSYQVKETTEVYFFTYSYNPETIESNSPTIYISNVFPVQKNGDDSWPFKANLMEKIAKTNPGLNLILSGYYLNKSEADIKQQQLLHEATEFGFIVNNINYVGKKSTLSSNSSTDYWGNPIKKTNNKPSTKQTTEQEPTKTKPQLDYWGNPIKQ